MLRLPKLDSNDEEERICAILCPNEPLDVEEYDFEPPESNEETLTCYYDFLKPQLKGGFKLMGREDIGYFGYEEPFYWGRDTKRPAQLSERASLEDKLEWIRLVDWNLEYGLMAEVRRIKDRKQFVIPLVDLEVCRQRIKEYQLIEDYSCWFVNYGPEAR